jgi:hypothetical protein
MSREMSIRLRPLAVVSAMFACVAPCRADDCSLVFVVRESDPKVVVRTLPAVSEIDVSKALDQRNSVGLKYSVARKDGKTSLRASMPGFPVVGRPARAILIVGASAVPDTPLSELKPTVETTAQEEFEGVNLTAFSATLIAAWKEGKDARLVIFAADKPAADLFLDGRVSKRAMAEMQLEMDHVFANAAAGKCTNAEPGGGGVFHPDFYR